MLHAVKFFFFFSVAPGTPGKNRSKNATCPLFFQPAVESHGQVPLQSCLCPVNKKKNTPFFVTTEKKWRLSFFFRLARLAIHDALIVSLVSRGVFRPAKRIFFSKETERLRASFFPSLSRDWTKTEALVSPPYCSETVKFLLAIFFF